MSTKTVSTRRSFITVAGAALSAPLAAAAAALPTWLPPSGGSKDSLESRLALLEDLNAIRAVNHAYATHVNAGAHEELAALFSDPSDARIDDGISGIAAEGFGDDDVIDIAADRLTATARVHCTVQVEAEIGPSCPLVEMARLQGGGVVSWAERRVFEIVYVRRDAVWKILRSTHRPL